VPFPLFSLQAQLVAAVISGSVVLPPLSARLEATRAHDEEREARGALTDSKYHYLGGDLQWAYCRRLLRLGTGSSPSSSSSSSPSSSSSSSITLSYLRAIEEIYADCSSRRPPLGGEDAYRSVRYSLCRDKGDKEEGEREGEERWVWSVESE